MQFGQILSQTTAHIVYDQQSGSRRRNMLSMFAQHLIIIFVFLIIEHVISNPLDMQICSGKKIIFGVIKQLIPFCDLYNDYIQFFILGHLFSINILQYLNCTVRLPVEESMAGSGN